MKFTNLKIQKEKYEKQIFKKANVLGIGIGFKIKNNKELKKKCIVVLVKKKVPIEKLNKKDIIPKKFKEGAVTDVIETGEIKALSIINHKKKYRPAPGGVSIGHYKISAGTLGMIVKQKNQKFILSNNHVLANSNDSKKGDLILQPGRYDSQEKNNEIAKLHKFIKINFLPSKKENYVDAAIAKPISEKLITENIIEIGKPKKPKNPRINQEIKKSGRTTGLTKSKISLLNTTVTVSYSKNQSAIFKDQLISPGFSQPGDSGSIVLDNNNNIIGLLFAGNKNITIINKISNIKKFLKVTF